MAYCVTYEPEWKSKYVSNPKKSWDKRCVYGSVGLILLGLGMFSGVRNWIWDFLIPGDPDITLGAFKHLVGDLSEGETLSKAIMSFCQEIVMHA